MEAWVLIVGLAANYGLSSIISQVAFHEFHTEQACRIAQGAVIAMGVSATKTACVKKGG